MAEQSTFKISEIPQIQNIDNDDLLLVADKEGGKYYSRNMTIDQLVSKVLASVIVNPDIQAQIQTAASQAAAQAVEEADLPATVMQTIEDNSDDIYDMLDGKRDQQLVIDAR